MAKPFITATVKKKFSNRERKPICISLYVCVYTPRMYDGSKLTSFDYVRK